MQLPTLVVEAQTHLCCIMQIWDFQHTKVNSAGSELRKYSTNLGGSWPKLPSYKPKKYISNHCNMLGKDNRGSDREEDCHLHNGMLNEASPWQKNFYWVAKISHSFSAGNCQQKCLSGYRDLKDAFLARSRHEQTTPISWRLTKNNSSLLCTQVDIWKNLTVNIKRDGEGDNTTLNIAI